MAIGLEEGNGTEVGTANRPLQPRVAKVLALLMLGAAVLAALLLIAGSRPLLVPYWYALPPFDPALGRLLLLAAVLLVYGLGAYLLRAGPAWLTLAWALAGGMALPVAFLALLGDPLEVLLMRTISSQTTGGFSKGIDLTAETVRNWPALMADWRASFPHVAISLPGWPLAYAGLVRLFGAIPTVAHTVAVPLRALQCHQWGFNTLGDAQIASAWLGVLSPFWSALTVLPLFALGRRVAGKEGALLTVLLWPLVPAAALFAGTLNSPYPLLATLVVLPVYTGVTAESPVRRAILLSVAGVLSAGSIVLNLALAPLLLFCAILVLALRWMQADVVIGTRFLRAVVDGLWYAVGMVVVFAAYWLLAGHSPLRVLEVALGVHFGMERAYVSSLGLHLWDFVLFLGLPLAVLAVLGVAVRWKRGEPPEALRALAAALAITLVVLLLSGTAQGEVGRVWSFFMPFMVLLAAQGLRRLPRPSAVAFLAAQAIWLLALAGTTAPVDTWLGARPAYATVAPAPMGAPVLPASARFGDVLQLTGFQSETDEARRTLKVALHWKALASMDRPYYFSAVLVGPDGRVLPGVTWQPFEKRYPTTCWAPGSTIVEQVTLPLGGEYASGNWWLSLAAFSLKGNEPPVLLPVALPGGGSDKQAGIGPLPVQ